MIHALAIALCLSVPMPPPAMPAVRDVLIEDPLRFGVSIEAARNLANLAAKHGDLMRGQVVSNNDRESRGHWEIEVAWRAKCWARLRVALDVETARFEAWGQIAEEREPTAAEVAAAQLDALQELLGLIGPADYHAGRMPAPMPSYRPWSD